MYTLVNFEQYGSKAALDRTFGNHWLYICRANGYVQLEASPLANPFKVSEYDWGGTLPHFGAGCRSKYRWGPWHE